VNLQPAASAVFHNGEQFRIGGLFLVIPRLPSSRQRRKADACYLDFPFLSSSLYRDLDNPTP
jgi:hypothetical protein